MTYEVVDLNHLSPDCPGMWATAAYCCGRYGVLWGHHDAQGDDLVFIAEHVLADAVRRALGINPEAAELLRLAGGKIAQLRARTERS